MLKSGFGQKKKLNWMMRKRRKKRRRKQRKKRKRSWRFVNNQGFALPILSYESTDGKLVHQYPFTHLGGERRCESKVSCPATRCSWMALKPRLPNLEEKALTMRRPLDLHRSFNESMVLKNKSLESFECFMASCI